MSNSAETIPKCFMAYPSFPERVGEIMRDAATTIQDTKVADLIPWQFLNVGGNIIITQICQAIDESSVFICDLTYLNPNVLFELGYAIAKKKNIWILLDPSIIESKKNYSEFLIISTIGYDEYTSASDIVRKFFDNKILDKKNILREQLASFSCNSEKSEEKVLFYLKPAVRTDSSIKAARRVSKSAILQVVDDPGEVRSQPFAWYMHNVTKAYALIVHLLSCERTGWKLHNAKQALISGLAHGLGINLLMLADEPYSSPVDYKDLLRVSRTPNECEKFVDNWLNNIEQLYLRDATSWRMYQERQKANISLQGLSIGDYVAENESSTICDYFVPTSFYLEAKNSQQAIFVGRKGTGKTANLYKLSKDLSEDKRNHICIIKPADYDLHGLVRLFNEQREKSEKGFMVESLWKFLIYSELLKSLFDDLKSKPSFYIFSDEETALLQYCGDNSEIIELDFATRLDHAIEKMSSIGDTEATPKMLRISEILHDKSIKEMRNILCSVLIRKSRVMLLIDGLDAIWAGDPSKELSEILWGLLSVVQGISRDLTNSRKNIGNRIYVSVVLFIRSDIFYKVLSFAKEKDKISYSKLIWDDNEKLINIIDERFKSTVNTMSPEQVWEKYFVLLVKGIPIKQYIVTKIIPRPRDIIYFVRAAIAEAVNRRHAKVEENDIVSAEKKYSQYVWDSVAAECNEASVNMDEISMELLENKSIMSVAELNKILISAKIPEQSLDSCIELLKEVSFIGVEVNNGDFRYAYDPSELKHIEIIAKRFRLDHGLEERVRIHSAFHNFLEMVES